MDSKDYNVNEEKIVVNGSEYTTEEFARYKEEVSSQKGMKLIEVSKNVYKTRIQE